MNIYIITIIFLFLYLAVFAISEFLFKKGVKANVTRKIAHVLGGLITVALPIYLPLSIIIGIGVTFSLLLLLSKKHDIFSSIHAISEDSHGETLFVPVFTVLAIIGSLTDVMIFQGAVLIAALSDGFSGLVGERYGKHVYNIMGKKTIEGSITFFIITLLILYFFVSSIIVMPLWTILVGTLIITIVEGILSKGWDNVGVPITSAILIYLFI